jgi:hypothetical protein
MKQCLMQQDLSCCAGESRSVNGGGLPCRQPLDIPWSATLLNVSGWDWLHPVARAHAMLVVNRPRLLSTTCEVVTL